jgi:GTP:adenosylcobinamide-phosphate guanylyltransferase
MFDDPQAFANVNTPEELKQLEEVSAWSTHPTVQSYWLHPCM